MGREPALGAAPMTLDRDQFSPAALFQTVAETCHRQQWDSWRKLGRRTLRGCGRLGGGHQHQLEATGRGYRETENISEE